MKECHDTMKAGDAREHELAPLTGEDPAVLILGSFPSRASLAAGRYYANPRNHFWPIMQSLLALEGAGIPEWESGLVAARVAVWDVIASRRFQPGSMDHDIRDEEWNDIAGFLDNHPAIRCICLNGWKASDSFRRCMNNTGVPSTVVIHRFPSSSPANARHPLHMKIELWRPMLGCLKNVIT